MLSAKKLEKKIFKQQNIQNSLKNKNNFDE